MTTDDLDPERSLSSRMTYGAYGPGRTIAFWKTKTLFRVLYFENDR